MGLSNPNNALEESWLLFFLTGILGLRVPRSRTLRWIGALYPILIVVTHCVLFFETNGPMSKHCDSFSTVIRYLKNQKLRSCVNLVALPVLLISSLGKSSEDPKVCRDIDEVDKLLVYLNVSVNRRAAMKRQVLNLVVHLSLNILANLWTYSALVTADRGVFFDAAAIHDYASTLVAVVTISGFVTFIDKIRRRFETVNRAIAEALKNPGKVRLIVVRPANDSDNESRLRLARRVHLKLEEVASAVNKAYRFRLLFVFVLNFLSVITNLREALSLVGSSYGAVDICVYVLWISFHMGGFFYYSNACRAVVAEAQLAREFFIEASLTQGPIGLSDEAKTFSQQVANNKFELTLISLSSTEWPKVLTIIIGMVTYLSLVS